MRFTSICLLLGLFKITFAQWPLGLYGGRSWTKIDVPGCLCGDSSTPYSFFYSPAITESAKYRLSVYLPGGGSTLLMSDSTIATNLKSLNALKGLLSISTVNGSENFFMDRPENTIFIGDGHWVIFPYCTQDFYSGRLEEKRVYDFTYLEESNIKKEVEYLLNSGFSVDLIESVFPSIKIKDYTINPIDDYRSITSLEVSVLHRGALNMEVAVPQLLNMLVDSIPDFIQYAKILVSGGSAGSFGAWYNFHLFGDICYGQSDASLTLIPMGGSPTKKIWSDSAWELIVDPVSEKQLTDRLNYYQMLRPCEIPGGAFIPSGSDACDDVLDLLDHYKSKRYPDQDIIYIPVANKQDFVLSVGLLKLFPDYNQLTDALMNLCKTTHAYSLRLAQTENTYPYLIWTYLKESSPLDDYFGRKLKPEHVPEKAVFLQKIQNINDNNTQSISNLLEFINTVAARNDISNEPIHIEFMPNIILDEENPNSGIELFYDVFDGKYNDCNCPSKTTVISINEQEVSLINSIYMNGTQLNVTFSLVNEAKLIMEFYNLSGRQVFYTQEKKYSSGDHHLTFNIELSSGIYVYQIIYDNNIISKKILVTQ